VQSEPEVQLVKTFGCVIFLSFWGTLTVFAGNPKPSRSSTPGLADLETMANRFASTPLRVDTSSLSLGDRQALAKLIQAARVLDELFMKQLWSGNPELYSKLQKDKTPLGKARLRYFWLNKGPWSDIDEYKAFLPGVPPRKLPGSNFYPADMSKEDFEGWIAGLPESEQAQAKGFFTVIRWLDKKGGGLTSVPYNAEYKAELTTAAGLLHDASDLTENTSLKKFLTTRAEAFLSNDYYESDLAWMDLDAPLDVTIGPYETYNDELFGYKASFEAYINLRDDEETAKLSAFTQHLQEIEDNLPIDPKYRNPKLGAAAPIRVVDQIISTGDGAHGVKTAAYNLPNDERVVQQKGSKRVMLKNVQEAKFHTVLIPIAMRTLSKKAMIDVSFNSFFTHMLAHELMHGLGPHQITVDGRTTTPRAELKELYSAIEEAKADVTGLFALQYMMDHANEMKIGRVLPSDEAAQRQLYTTFLASAFRSLRFGLNDAHGKGMAVQFNYLSDHGAFVEHGDGTFDVDMSKIKGAVQDLDHDLLTLEAEGNYAGAKEMLENLGVLGPVLKRAFEKLSGIPTDIEPVFVTAESIAPLPDNPPLTNKAHKKSTRKRR
jgi:Peptidase family M49